MRFAVIEYTSKSGKIWRHSPEKPNYLADPQKEIDPTSFGGYVSALAGEHIPLTHLIRPTFMKKAIKRIRGSWPQSYSLDYLKQFDVLMVVHQISDAHEIAAFVKRLKHTFPNIFIIGVPTQPFGTLKPHIENHPEAKLNFVEYMNTCDVFLSVVKATQPWYQALTTTPVVYLPQIYPAHFASKHFMPLEQKEKIIFAAGITDRSNIAKGFKVARQLQKDFPEYAIMVTQIPGVPMDFSDLEDARYEVVGFQQWREHLPWLAKIMLVINTDYTLTRGRVQVDCAAVGTPSLGANSDGQTDLFPALASSESTSAEELVALGRKLIVDPDYYKQTTQSAFERLKKYDYEESAARLSMLVKTYRRE